MKHRFLIILLGCLSMLGAFSIDTYLPSFPSIAAEFHVGIDTVQQTLTVFLLAMAVMTLFHGTVSDAVGRRPVILGSLAIYLAASIGAFLANSFSWLLFCRILQGMSAGAGMVVGRAMVRDRLSGPDAQAVMSYTTIVFGLAPVVAPILGGWLEVISGWRSVFVFLAVFGFLLLAACAFKLPESLPLASRSPLRLRATLKDYATVGSDARFLLQSSLSPSPSRLPLAPLLFGNAFKLACGILAGHLASAAFWFCGQQKNSKAFRMTGTSTRAFGSSPMLFDRKIGAKDSSRCFPGSCDQS